MESTLEKVKRLEESGALDTLVELSEFIGSAKNSLTNPMISETMERAIKGIEIADDLVQLGAIEIVQGMVGALHEAIQERAQEKEPLSLFQIMRTLQDPEVRAGISLMLAFLKKLPSKLK